MGDTNLDDYWQREEFVARLPLPPQNYESDIFFLWHQSRERYGRDHREIGVKLSAAGERDYVHVKACFYVPRIILTVALTPPVETDIGEEIGEVVDSHQEGSDRHFIAGLQAWYYPSARTLMLWEVNLFGSYRDEDPAQDFLLSTLWHYFEQGLLERFPVCERIVTPSWEPSYEPHQWERFLAARGYTPHYENTYSKAIGKS